MIEILGDLIPILRGFLVNLEIAAAATLLGIVVGMPIAWLRYRVRFGRRLLVSIIRLMQAAPTYVIMFFVLTLMPSGLSIAGVAISGLLAVIIAQSVYMAAYVADNFFRTLQHIQRGEREQALLILPNLMRGFFVIIMSSGFGAAIGVSEAVSTTLRQAEHLHLLSDRVLLFVYVIAFFVIVFAAANAVIQLLIRRLSARPRPA